MLPRRDLQAHDPLFDHRKTHRGIAPRPLAGQTLFLRMRVRRRRMFVSLFAMLVSRISVMLSVLMLATAVMMLGLMMMMRRSVVMSGSSVMMLLRGMFWRLGHFSCLR
jgi:hypothetical protein